MIKSKNYNYFFIFLVIFLVASITPASAQTVKDADKEFDNRFATAIKKAEEKTIQGTELSPEEKSIKELEAEKELPQIMQAYNAYTTQYQTLVDVAFEEVTDNISQETLNARFNSTIKILEETPYNYKLTTKQNINYTELGAMPIDNVIVQVVDPSGPYIRYMYIESITPTHVKFNSLGTRTITLTKSQFEATYPDGVNLVLCDVNGRNQVLGDIYDIQNRGLCKARTYENSKWWENELASDGKILTIGGLSGVGVTALVHMNIARQRAGYQDMDAKFRGTCPTWCYTSCIGLVYTSFSLVTIISLVMWVTGEILNSKTKDNIDQIDYELNNLKEYGSKGCNS